MVGIEKYSNVELTTFDCDIVSDRQIEIQSWEKLLLPN